MKHVFFISCIFFPVVLFILNPSIRYHWIIDNLLGLPAIFYVWYFFLSFLGFLIYSFKDFIKFSLLTILSILIFNYVTQQEKETFQNTKTEEIYFSTFQYNMFYKENAIESAKKIILKENPDILVFQEISTNMGVKLYDFFKKDYRYSIGRRAIEGFPSQQLFMSKQPIEEKKIEEFMNRKHRFITATLNIKDQSIYFYIMHPPSPKRKNDWKERNSLLRKANVSLMTQPNPFVLIGDLNITINSNQFKHIFNSDFYNFNPLTDGHTWRAFNIPYISEHILVNEIDQTLTSKNIFVIEKTSFKKERASDHYPVLSKFKLILK